MYRFSTCDFPRDGWDDTMRHHGKAEACAFQEFCF